MAFKTHSKMRWFLVFMSFMLVISFNNCAEAPQGRSEEASSDADPNDVGAAFSGQLTSSIISVSSSGVAFGYAYDRVNPTRSIRVLFYIDGAVGTGTFIGDKAANEAGFGSAAGHYFTFQIPAGYNNGTNRTLHIYGHDAVPAYSLRPAGVPYVGYTPKAEPIFNEQIRGFVQSNCVQCHTWNYQTLYSGPLLTPTPISGGTATNNRFIRKMSGAEGHSGGQFCGGNINGGICAEIQRWWRAEFQ